MSSDIQQNPYLILGVPDFADNKQITDAYRRLARRFHPDVNHDPKAKEHMQEINWAYKLLSNPEARSRYDQTTYAPATEGMYEGGLVEEAWNPRSYRRRKIPKPIVWLWTKVFAHEIGYMRRKSSAAVMGVFFVVAIFAVCSILSNPALGIMIALPAAWLIPLYQPMGFAGRSSSVIGTIIGFVLSTMVSAGYVFRLSEGTDAMIESGQVILLFAIPIATIGGSLVGMLGSEK
jgi:hypothetical protein